ncbi:hypothetical protein A2U01_0047738, partial [Trifolium medium]|nr:hypothetical protein [Trifolium medium]
MLKRVLWKGKKTNSPHEEEPVTKKRSSRLRKVGEGSSRPQPQEPQAQEEQQGEISYAASFVVNYPYMMSGHHPWSDRFYREECKKRYGHISKFKMLQEKGFCDGLPEVPALNQQLKARKWLKFNSMMEKGKYVGNP